MGWGGTKNGALLLRAAGEFDVLLTVDSNMEFQQNLAILPLAVVVLVAVKNDIELLRPLMPQVRGSPADGRARSAVPRSRGGVTHPRRVVNEGVRGGPA